MKITHFINTSGLIYDDRLIKESKTLTHFGVAVDIIAFEARNKKQQGDFEGIRYKTLRMITRALYPRPRQMLWLKAIEFNLRLVFALLGKFKHTVWMHNFEMQGGVLLAVLLKRVGFLKGVIWDQHELPPRKVEKRWVFKRIFVYSCRKCDYVISANVARLKFLRHTFGNSIGSHHVILNNHPEREIILSDPRSLPQEVSSWIGSSDYILFQGHATYERKILECGRAVKEHGRYKMIVVGPITDEVVEQLRIMFGDDFEDQVYLTGMVPQEQLYVFIDNCLASLVFYGNINPNHWLCEPNRFYQAICRKRPVICGANPPMKDIVTRYKCGYSTTDDGSDYRSIIEGIDYVSTHKRLLELTLEECAQNFLWESNYRTFRTILNLNQNDK